MRSVSIFYAYFRSTAHAPESGKVMLPARRPEMFDATMIVAGLACFVVAIAYVYACDRL
jgi:hypothetical protein